MTTLNLPLPPRIVVARLTLTLTLPPESGEWREDLINDKLSDPAVLKRIAVGVQSALSKTKWLCDLKAEVND